MQNVAVVLYAFSAATWLKYCRYGVKLYPINQLYALLIFKHFICQSKLIPKTTDIIELSIGIGVIVYINLENRPRPRSPKTKCTTCTTFFSQLFKSLLQFLLENKSGPNHFSFNDRKESIRGMN